MRSLGFLQNASHANMNHINLAIKATPGSHNRACVCPDHLVIGSYQQNTQDEDERRYAGRDSKGRGQQT